MQEDLTQEGPEKTLNEMSLYQLTNEFELYEEALTYFYNQEKPDRNKFDTSEEYDNAVKVYEMIEDSLRQLEENLVSAIGNKVDNWARFLQKLDDDLEVARSHARRVNKIVKVRNARHARATAFLKNCLEKLNIERLEGSLHGLKIALNGGKKAVEYDGETWVRSEFAGSQYANLGRVVSKLMSDGLCNDEVRRLAEYYEENFGMTPKDALERAYLSYLTEGESERFDYDADRIRDYVKENKQLPPGFSIAQKTHLKIS